MIDWYTVAKFIHVCAAIAWVGGGITLFTLGLMANRRADDAGSAKVIEQVSFLSTRWFIPSSMVTLIAGLIMAIGYNLWGQAWVVLGLLGFLATFAIGFFILKPTSEAIDAANKAGRQADAKAGGQKMLTVSKFDYTLLFVVVADMVFRPQWSDWLLLLIMAVVLAGAGYLFLYPMFRPKAAAA
jgi:uncharacterized membrane protein